MHLLARKRPTRLKKAQFSLRKLFKPAIVSIDGLRISVPATLPPELRKALYKEIHEYEERQLVRLVIDRSDRVLEVGTGIGLIALTCASICGGDAVLCYEANPRMAEVIAGNFKLNGVDLNLRNRAIATRAGEIEFFFNDNIISSSLIDRGFGGATQIPCDPIDEVVRDFKPTAIVMDAEGAEIDLLPAAPLDGVNKILVELHAKIVGQEAVDRLENHLAEAGFIKQPSYSLLNVAYFARPEVG